jgi:transcriptional regulator with XRE-family HTH domain
MPTVDPLWSSSLARALVSRQTPGALIRMGRQARGWRQVELGRRVGCSASTISRVENGRYCADLRLLRRVAEEVGVPTHLLGAALGLTTPSATTVTAEDIHSSQEAPMRRRTLLAAAGVATPAQLLLDVDEAMARMPSQTGAVAPLGTRMAHARSLFDAGQHSALLAVSRAS